MKENFDINAVKNFWELNPLFKDESVYVPGTKKYFKRHSEVYFEDCFAGELDKNLFPENIFNGDVLDLGCGPGFWVEQIIKYKPNSLTAIDLTYKAVELTKKRCKYLGIDINESNIVIKNGNAEKLEFIDEYFDHINCQGVIHHTPNTKKAIDEICRVTKKGGTALISVYYKNFILRCWPWISFIGRLLTFSGVGLKGRGREKIFMVSDLNKLVRYFDGDQNPIGKAYSKKQIISLLPKGVKVVNVFYHFFPLRALPFGFLKIFHKFLDRFLPFMIYITIKKNDI